MEHRLSQRAAAAAVGLTPQHLGRVESGGFFPSAEVVIKLAEIFGVTTDSLLNDAPQPAVAPPKVGEPLRQRVALLDQLDETDQQALTHIIDCMLTKQKLRQLVQNPAAGQPA
jgi:transcriptional regulator with XRE-family HTH domain